MVTDLGPRLDSYDPDSEEAAAVVEVGRSLDISEPAG